MLNINTKKNIIIALLIITNNLTFAQTNLNNYFKAITALENKQNDSALMNINISLSQEPENQVFINLKGEILYQTKKYKTAITYLKKNKNTNYQLAKCYSQMKNTDSAIYFLKKYLKTKNKKYKTEIIFDIAFKNIEKTQKWKELWEKEHYSKKIQKLHEAKYNYKYNKIEIALENVNYLIEKYNNFHQAYFLKSQILYSGKNFKKALKFVNKAIKISPSNVEYYTHKALINSSLNKIAAAAEDYEKYLSYNKYNLKIYKKLAEIYLQNNKNQQALNNINFYTNFYPTNKEALLLKAQIYYKMNDFIETLKITNKLVKIQQNNTEYIFLRGKAYLNTNSYKLAFNDFSNILDINPKNTKIFYYRALAQYKTGNTKEACADWKTAINNKDYKANEYYYKLCQKYQKK